MTKQANQANTGRQPWDADMPDEEVRYSPRYLGEKDTAKIKASWDNDLIMDWIETQPNPLKAPEFYEPMAEHDPLQITLSREIRTQLGEVWSQGDDGYVHPLAVEYFEHEEERAAAKASCEVSEAVLASLREMGIEDNAGRLDWEESEEEDDDDVESDKTVVETK